MANLIKKLRRCYIPYSNWHGQHIDPDDSCIHYLTNVLRLKEGEHLIIFDGTGREVVGKVFTMPEGKKRILILKDIVPQHSESTLNFVLVQAIPKGNKMDWIVEKAVELGVTQIIPVVTERVIVKLDEKKVITRRDRWQKIAESAARQCGRTTITKIYPATKLADVFQIIKNLDLLLVGSLMPEAESIFKIINTHSNISSIALMIGPEGDFTSEEYQEMKKHGVIPVSFGRRVLRVETAAICGIAIVMSAYGGGILP